jgi:hypothetical protein
MNLSFWYTPQMAAEKFLEVGKFNKRVWADKTTDKLSQFGFPFSVVQKNNLWKKSYQVLVGPYGSAKRRKRYTRLWRREDSRRDLSKEIRENSECLGC